MRWCTSYGCHRGPYWKISCRIIHSSKLNWFGMKLTQWWIPDHQLWHLAMCRIFYEGFQGPTQLFPNKEELWSVMKGSPSHIHWESFWSKLVRAVIVNWFTLSLWAAVAVCVIMCVGQPHVHHKLLITSFQLSLEDRIDENVFFLILKRVSVALLKLFPLYIFADCIFFLSLQI